MDPDCGGISASGFRPAPVPDPSGIRPDRVPGRVGGAGSSRQRATPAPRGGVERAPGGAEKRRDMVPVARFQRRTVGDLNRGRCPVRRAPGGSRPPQAHPCHDGTEVAADVRYCWFNPVKHGFTERPEDRAWSQVAGGHAVSAACCVTSRTDGCVAQGDGGACVDGPHGAMEVFNGRSRTSLRHTLGNDLLPVRPKLLTRRKRIACFTRMIRYHLYDHALRIVRIEPRKYVALHTHISRVVNNNEFIAAFPNHLDCSGFECNVSRARRSASRLGICGHFKSIF